LMPSLPSRSPMPPISQPELEIIQHLRHNANKSVKLG
jgi:hypothetical protein